MRINTAKHRMGEGHPAIGAAIVLGCSMAGEVLSQSGYDFVLVDCQHGVWDGTNVLTAFHSICLGNAVPMARVEQNDFYAIGSLLDRGALGIVVPMVNSPADARRAADAVRYPPRGQRSVGGAGAIFYGPDYTAEANDEIFLAVQIESAQAVEQAEAILAEDGVDGCWIGPADLAKSLGVDLSTAQGRARHEQAILRVCDACRQTGKIPGIAGNEETAEHWLSEGFLFVTVVTDYGLLAGAGERVLKELRSRPGV